ncbi:serine/threonine-protein kinase HipA [Kribbella antiqua]|uniref:Serine/threonine-protein kinase HipA n=1 Tax=Kribbella antiqua TaxID=2512217 RepID=A0A4R2IYZ9_9ACTN|nr:type II toxin-antitoxin system HipA family toxin [Kribbella antiqua]TCO48235.1 serine/threonine-protein kinase HipA [Kribbella antiqua]
MSVTELCLLLGDELAGTVTRLSNGKLNFRYDDTYVSKGATATPISVSMPTHVTPHTDSQITPWLWGLLPDDDAVLNRWAREFQVSAGSAFALLATPVGEDCPGAVRLIPPDRLPAVAEPGLTDVDWLGEAQIAQRLRDLKRDNTAWLGANHAGRFSLAGAQAKTALLRDGDRWGDPHGSVATSHILKPAIEGLDNHDLNEHLCLSAMQAAGLFAVGSRIERFEDQSAIVVARYDRRLRDGRQIRVHQEDLCQALGVHPVRKYQNEGGPGPRDIASLLSRAIPRSDARKATLSFLDALVWNWVIAGTDAHAKNYSLLLQGQQVRLAPFYDVASALPYDSYPEQKMRLAMKFGSGYQVNPASSPWARIASDLHLPVDEVRDRAARLVATAPDAFSTAAADPAVRRLESALPERLTDLVAQRAARCARYLNTGSG